MGCWIHKLPLTNREYSENKNPATIIHFTVSFFLFTVSIYFLFLQIGNKYHNNYIYK